MSLSCSEPSCGSISLRVKARVFPVASEAPHDLLSAPAPLTLPLAHSVPATEASSSVLTLPVQGRGSGCSLCLYWPSLRRQCSMWLRQVTGAQMSWVQILAPHLAVC